MNKEIEIVKSPAEKNEVYSVKDQFKNIELVENTLTNIAKVGEIIKSKLKEGVDYGTIPRVQKPFLFGAGAEKIAVMLGVSPSYEIITAINDLVATPFIVSYVIKCSISIINSEGEKVIINEGFGAANNREKGKNNPDKTDQARMVNDLLKIAKKRAFVDSIKSLAAASDVFTQDEEVANDVKKTVDIVSKVEKLKVYGAVYNSLGIKTDEEKVEGKKFILNLFAEWKNKNNKNYKFPLDEMNKKDFISWVEFVKSKINNYTIINNKIEKM